MFKENRDNNNFWISYADLMAGLLFVFILLIGAIVSKSITLREDLNKQKEVLNKTVNSLKEKESSLVKLNIKVKEQEKTIKLQKDEIYELRALLDERLKELKQKNRELNKTKEVLAVTKDSLKLKSNELNRLNQLLLAKNSKIDKLNGKIIILQNLLKDTNTTLAEKEKLIQDYKNRVLILSNNLTRKEDELNLTNEKLKKLLIALDEKESNYETLLKELQQKKAKIKYLTGIRLRVIDELKKTLGDKIKVSKDGSLKLSSKILFDKGSSKLKDSAKEILKEQFNKYIAALMSNEAIRPYIDSIVIEGHTDSDGGFLYNLELSQNRALSVMSYLLTLPIAKEYNLEKYLTASGRSYLDRVMVNGVEDKNASRRIEIKFRLKNQNALYEIEKILDENR